MILTKSKAVLQSGDGLGRVTGAHDETGDMEEGNMLWAPHPPNAPPPPCWVLHIAQENCSTPNR